MEINIHLCKHLFTLLRAMVSLHELLHSWIKRMMITCAHGARDCPGYPGQSTHIRQPCWRTARRQWKRLKHWLCNSYEVAIFISQKCSYIHDWNSWHLALTTNNRQHWSHWHMLSFEFNALQIKTDILFISMYNNISLYIVNIYFLSVYINIWIVSIYLI